MNSGKNEPTVKNTLTMANTAEFFKPSDGVVFKSTNAELRGTQPK